MVEDTPGGVLVQEEEEPEVAMGQRPGDFLRLE